MQDEDCKATPSRYAIWGEDIRSLSISAKKAMRNGNSEKAEKLIIKLLIVWARLSIRVSAILEGALWQQLSNLL